MKTAIKNELRRFLAEDVGKGDVTSRLLKNDKIKARIITRDSGIVAGTDFAKELFAIKKCRVIIRKKDGSKVLPNDTILEINGPARSVLAVERTALNLLSRMSGIATITSQFVKKTHGTSAKIYATRKTAPGLRFFDKEAVAIGGGKKHRMKLDEMIMIKDNHLAIAKSLEKIIRSAKKRGRKFEVEVESQKGAIVAAQNGASIIMLDNFLSQDIASTVKELKKLRLRNKVKLEASGGINLKNVRKFAQTGVDMVSVGSITISARALDFSLEI